MSFEYCKSIKRNERNEIELELACNNVAPRTYEWTKIKNVGGTAVAELARLVYSGDVKLLASAKRTSIGQQIEWAIKQVGRMEYGDGGMDWAEYDRRAERVGELALLGNK